jgi:DNA-binding SARP family transcriptional activator
LRLNTLGGIRVVSDGNVVSGAAAQPRRLAVLALLARAGRAGVTREKIIALLWPDEPDDRARRTLNQAVYSLRRDLGNDDTLQGSKDLRLNLDLIEVDTVEFQDALDVGDLERAVRLYDGPFLDGFFLTKAPDFERWVEAERSAISRDYAAALERVAIRASERGDTAGAVIHWRKLAATDPLNARVALSVMRALIAAGDANGAIQHARLHEALLDQELGLPPDRDVAALARQLRERTDSVESKRSAPTAGESSVSPGESDLSAAAAAPAERAVSVAAEPVTASRRRERRWSIIAGVAAAVVVVAVASVAFLLKRSRTSGDPSGRPVVAVGAINDYASSDSSGVARALRDMLSTNLARSPELRVVSGSRLLELERQMSGGSRVAGAIVPVARQAGATTLIEGALFPISKDTLRLDLRVINLQDGNVLRPFTVSGHDPFALADSATARLVAFLGSTAPRGSVADATTRSVTAYRLYEEGLRAFYLGDIEASKRLFDASLQDDSTFAMAAYYSARATQTSRTAYLTAMRRAVALAARASDRDRLIIEGSWAETNNSPSLRAIAETLATRFPSEVEGHYYLGRALVNAGLFTQAIVPLHRVEVMDSLSLRGGDPRCVACDALLQQAVSYLLADSAAAAERVLRRWLAARPNTWVARIELGRTLSTVGRSDEAVAEYRKAEAIDSTRPLFEPRASLWIRTGQFARADSLLRSEIANGSGPQPEPHWFLGISLRNQGKFSEALGDARAYRRGYAGVERAEPDAAEPSSLMEAQVYRELGRYREAAALFDSVARFKVIGAEPSGVASSRVWSLTHRAGALAAGGDTSRLTALADTIEATGALSNLARDQRLHHHVRGLLFAARGNDSAAVAEFRRAIWSTTFGYTRTNVEMAKSLLRLGRYGDGIAILEPALRGSLEASNLYVTHSEIRLLLAEAYARAGQRDRAAVEMAWVQRAWANADPPVRARLAAAQAATK